MYLKQPIGRPAFAALEGFGYAPGPVGPALSTPDSALRPPVRRGRHAGKALGVSLGCHVAVIGCLLLLPRAPAPLQSPSEERAIPLVLEAPGFPGSPVLEEDVGTPPELPAPPETPPTPPQDRPANETPPPTAVNPPEPATVSPVPEPAPAPPAASATEATPPPAPPTAPLKEAKAPAIPPAAASRAPRSSPRREPAIARAPAARPPAEAKQEAAASMAPPPRTAPVLVPARPVAGMSTNRPPVYPPMAQRRGEEGSVMLRVDVGADGQPRAVVVLRGSGHAQLDEAAAEAVRQWRFVPATSDNIPIAAAADVPVNFRLPRP